MQQTHYLINWKSIRRSYYVQDWCSAELGRKYKSSFKVYSETSFTKNWWNQSIVTLFQSIDWFLYDKSFYWKVSKQTIITFFQWMFLLLLTLNSFRFIGKRYKSCFEHVFIFKMLEVLDEIRNLCSL